MMTFDIVTIFPAMIEQPLAAGILGRAIERGTLDVRVRDLRDYTTDRHRVVDGAAGEVLIPLVGQICTLVDPQSKRIVIDPPAGLIEANARG